MGDKMLHGYLYKLERLIESQPDHCAKVRRRYQSVFAWQDVDPLPFVWSELPPVADSDWPEFPYNDAFYDREKMLLSQLRQPFLHFQSGDDHPLAIRANYGTVILPTVFGAGYQLTETSLPWAHHLPDRDAIRRLVDAGVPRLSAGLGAVCFETAAYYREALAPFPRLAREVWIYHPDLQGPFDVAHLLWGPDIFLALYDEPELVHALLDLVVRTYIAWLQKWKAEIGEGNHLTAHWSIMMRGGAMLRDDTPVMLSRAQYDTFVKPYDQRVLDVFGGCIHFCGRGDHWVQSMAASRNLYGLNLSQPDWNNMERVWSAVRDHRLVLLDLREGYLPSDIHTGVTVRRSWAPTG